MSAEFEKLVLEKLTKLDEAVTEKITNLDEAVTEKITNLDEKFTDKLTKVDTRIETLEKLQKETLEKLKNFEKFTILKLEEHDKKFDRLETRVENLQKDMQITKGSVMIMEQKISTEIPALFDGYSMNYEKQQRQDNEINSLNLKIEDHSVRISCLEQKVV